MIFALRDRGYFERLLLVALFLVKESGASGGAVSAAADGSVQRLRVARSLKYGAVVVSAVFAQVRSRRAHTADSATPALVIPLLLDTVEHVLRSLVENMQVRVDSRRQ